MEKNILFVCVENAGRSQMAHAFANIYGQGKVNVYSAGSRPSGVINPKAIEIMKEVGYDLTTHKSKSLLEVPNIEYEYVVTMGCGDECGNVRTKNRLDWTLRDPKVLSLEQVREVRDEIKEKVIQLIQSL